MHKKLFQPVTHITYVDNAFKCAFTPLLLAKHRNPSSSHWKELQHLISRSDTAILLKLAVCSLSDTTTQAA